MEEVHEKMASWQNDEMLLYMEVADKLINNKVYTFNLLELLLLYFRTFVTKYYKPLYRHGSLKWLEQKEMVM